MAKAKKSAKAKVVRLSDRRTVSPAAPEPTPPEEKLFAVTIERQVTAYEAAEVKVLATDEDAAYEEARTNAEMGNYDDEFEEFDHSEELGSIEVNGEVEPEAAAR